MAVMATSATLIAVFLPVSFMGGMAGQYFKQFGITVAVSVAFSLLVARLITPLLTAYFLKNDAHSETPPGPVIRWYGRMLEWTLRHRLVTVVSGLAIFAASIWLATLLPTGLFPEEDQSRSELAFELPPGVTMGAATATLLEISDRLQARPEVVSVYASLGDDGEDIRAGTVSVALTPPGQRAVDQRGFEREALAELAAIPDLRMNFMSGMDGRAFSMSLTGAEGPAVARAAEAIEAAIRDRVPALQNVQSKAAIERPELRIAPRPWDAAALGVSAAEIATVLRIATLGDRPQNLAKVSDGARRIDIKVVLPDAARRTAAAVG